MFGLVFRWFWPEKSGWAPLFRRHFWPPALIGVLLALVVRFTLTSGSSDASPVPERIQAIVFAAIIALAQILYLVAAAKMMNEASRVEAGRARTSVVVWLVCGLWTAALLGPMFVSLAISLGQTNMAIIGGLISLPGIFALAVVFQGLQSWDEDETSRRDVAAYVIQGGTVFLLFALGLVVSGFLSLADGADTGIAAEIARTLLYGATLLLVPSGLWTLRVIAANRMRQQRHNGRRSPRLT